MIEAAPVGKMVARAADYHLCGRDSGEGETARRGCGVYPVARCLGPGRNQEEWPGAG